MGKCGSKLNGSSQLTKEERDDIAEQKRRNEEIERRNQSDQDRDVKIRKLLLLGAGESGKSTFFKQVVDIYGAGFSKEEILNQVHLIYSNTIGSMQTLCSASEDFVNKGRENCKISAENEEFRAKIAKIDLDHDMTQEIAGWVQKLWSDPGIQATFEFRSEIQIPESCSYFFEHVDRFWKEDFCPTKQDLLRIRVRTTGILEANFNIEESKFKIVDVGGQRSERKKWINCFESVTAILFVAAVSEYDQTVFEDNRTNRIQESLALFEEVTGYPVFKHTPIILFLNKKDLFEEKLKRVPLNSYFTEFDGGEDVEKGIQFFQEMYINRSRIEDKDIYVHATCAMDDTNVTYVFQAVKDIVIKKGLANSGLF